MTEAEWLGCDDPQTMLNVLGSDSDLRKWRLLGAAMVRSDLPWRHLGGRRLTAAEWESTRPLLEAIEAAADSAAPLGLDLDFHHAVDVSEMLHGGTLDERAIEARIISDVFGNPFRPVTFIPEWRTDTAKLLAARMYESRDFSAMPILADALQDAGCDNADVITHCRDASQIHVRGCWVVDRVLEKA